jgi:hypothetical protein
MRFDALPNIAVSYRFFITGIAFGIMAAVLLLFNVEDFWLNRWHSSTIALMHCFTLGFLGFIMLGALMNILPVLTGRGFFQPLRVGRWGFSLLLCGAVSFTTGFRFNYIELQFLAGNALVLGFGYYLYASLPLFTVRSSKASIKGLRLALLLLLVTVALGLMLLVNQLTDYYITTDKQWTNIHAAFGFLGWIVVLVLAVSWQVIPMFFVTPEFPKKWCMPLAYVITGGLLSALVLQLFHFDRAVKYGLWLVSAAIVMASCWQWYLLSQRKRKVPDISVNFWRLAIVSLNVAILLLWLPNPWVSTILPATLPVQQHWLIAALMVVGFSVSVIQGMLIKILPFLSFTHLQQHAMKSFEHYQQLPHMHQFISNQQTKILWRLHITSLSFLLLSILLPITPRIFAVVLFIHMSFLLFLATQTVKLFYQTLRKFEK